ncbi:hypothetical protein MMC19_007637 [Ptychographa xylographoides]|nr:hypothetical protein [Ptychographa xylographoides]
MYYIGGGTGNLRYDETNEIKNKGNKKVEEVGENPDAAKIFPWTVHEVLSNLLQFPSLQFLSVRFDLYGSVSDGGCHASHMFDDEETAIQISHAEGIWPWRALMAKTYAALTLNDASCIKELQISQLVPLEVFTFHDTAFHRLLGTVEKFTLSLDDFETGYEWMFNTLNGYLLVVAKLNSFFFDHLGKATHLVIESGEEGPLWLKGMRHTKLALRRDQMPLLHTICGENLSVCPELIDFLVSYSDKLQHILLNQSYCTVNELADDVVSWKALFTSVSNAYPPKLHHFEISPIETAYRYFHEEQAVLEEAHIAQLLAEIPGKVVHLPVMGCYVQHTVRCRKPEPSLVHERTGLGGF